MCGFLCAFGNIDSFDSSLKTGLSKLSRRGPDYEGIYKSNSVWLGHRRLSIIDLESRSNQPFLSLNGRYYITFNGEIYNYKILRDQLILSGTNLRTNSDTEVILELYILEGVKFLSRLEGMFAFCIWDSLEKIVFVARDAYGIKPLYFSKINNGYLISSQVKAIIATDLVSKKINSKGLAGYYMLGSIPDSCTIYNHIESVTAGEYLLIKNDKIICRQKWFELGSIWLRGMNEISPSKTNQEIISCVKNLLIESVDRHLVSDVPIGIFLSSGIDSGVLAGLVKERSNSSIIGITIDFAEFVGNDANESEGAKIIANHFGIEHYIRRVTKEEFISDLPKIFEAMDQPSLDGINVWYASKAAAELGIKVVLSGAGGDELFLGYNNFKRLPLLVKYSTILNKYILFRKISYYITSKIAFWKNNDRWNFFTNWSNTIEGAWWLSRSTMSPNTAKNIIGSNKIFDAFSPIEWVRENSGELSTDLTIALAQIESTMYLRNQLLKDSDWASMYHSVELRTPLVDLKLLKGLTPYIKTLKNFPKKQLLYLSLTEKKLPPEIINRKKTGFTIPINKWINEYTQSNIGWHRYVGIKYFE